MSFEDLDKGAKIDLHIHLFERQVARLDAVCRGLNCSRSALFDKLLDDNLGAMEEAARKKGSKS